MIEKAVIDLSHHNTIPQDLKQTANAGVVGIIHKASEGVTVQDSKYDSRRWLAGDAGLLWGAYHFIRSGRNEEQIANFLDVSGALLDPTMLVALDYEDPKVELDQVLDWLEQVAEQTQRSPVLYSGHVLKEKLTGAATPALTKYRLWLAQYGPQATLPKGYENWWLWQYTDQGTIPGINPPVDLNRFAGSKEDLVLGWPGAPVQGDVKVVMVDIYQPPGVQISIKINGVPVDVA